MYVYISVGYLFQDFNVFCICIDMFLISCDFDTQHLYKIDMSLSNVNYYIFEIFDLRFWATSGFQPPGRPPGGPQAAPGGARAAPGGPWAGGRRKPEVES